MDENPIKPNYTLTVDEMWNLVKGGNNNWGIEGYEVPRRYADDIHAAKWKREVEKMIKNPTKGIVWPPKDKEGNPFFPKRPNFLDEVIKWSNSFYNKEKAEEIIQNKPKLLEAAPKREPTKITYGKKMSYISLIERSEEKKYDQYEYRKDIIQEIDEKLKKEKEENNLGYWDKIKKKYKAKGGSLP